MHYTYIFLFKENQFAGGRAFMNKDNAACVFRLIKVSSYCVSKHFNLLVTKLRARNAKCLALLTKELSV